jgi:hypothetical protein
MQDLVAMSANLPQKIIFLDSWSLGEERLNLWVLLFSVSTFFV